MTAPDAGMPGGARSGEVVNFVSNLRAGDASGGYSARAQAALEVLSAAFDVRYVGPLNPKASWSASAISKGAKLLGLPRDFYFFSRGRLDAIARDYARQSSSAAAFDFFHGFTPWIHIRPSRRYIAWNDCTFHDYVRIYHDHGAFSRRDLARIENREADWLRKADGVIFRSRYFAERAIGHYGLNSERVRSLPNFGALAAPDRDVYEDGRRFLFISTNFAGKGGARVLEAFAAVRQRYPDAELWIVGDAPQTRPEAAGVRWFGFLRKSDPDELATLRGLFAQATALVHPTLLDTNPAVIPEAAYFGCPAIASRVNAIPEFLDDGRTGFLLPDPLDVARIADRMAWMLDNPQPYRAMRRRARERALAEFTRATFDARFLEAVMGIRARAGDGQDAARSPLALAGE